MGVLICGLKSTPVPLYGWKKTMNKFLVYTVIAILLGTVTMVVPLAVHELNSPPVRNKEIVFEVETTDARTTESSDVLGLPEEPAPTIDSYDFSQADSETKVVPEETNNYQVTFTETDITSNLSSNLLSIGLMMIPSFAIALGVFVLLRKRTN